MQSGLRGRIQALTRLGGPVVLCNQTQHVTIIVIQFYNGLVDLDVLRFFFFFNLFWKGYH